MRNMIKWFANLVPRPATMLDFAAFRLFNARPAKDEEQDRQAILDQLMIKGYVIISGYWAREECDRAVEEIERLFAKHPEHVRKYSDVRIFGAEELSEIIDRFHSDPFLQSLSDLHSGVKTVNVFTLANKVEASEGNKGSGEGWHKDSSFRQFKAFLYLSDVNEDCGPLELLAGSHKIATYLADMKKARLPFRQLRITDEQIDEMTRDEPGRRITIVGAAGTLILADTACVHRGRPPGKGKRYALTNYYVEPREINPGYIDAYHPVNAAKVLGLMPTSRQKGGR